MRWARFEHPDHTGFGRIEGDRVQPVHGSPFSQHSDSGAAIPLEEVHWLPPVVPPTFYCVGLNYPEHLTMAARLVGKEPSLPRRPDVGYRAVNALTGHGCPILLPADARRIEYEGELACVIGARARHLTRDNALDCLLGYTIGNDISERTWQKDDRTLWRAKNCDTFKPMGPWIETDFDIESARTRVRVNGRQVIDFPTSDMIFGVVDYLVEISRYITLVPGDVLWMGTEGEAEALQPGDEVEIEITGIGTLRNPVQLAPD
jgi:2-keto-4-pentenoate hydratase/2-oxohepta-3-ene-1,7-dioic acid hydratase in catechol pathway